MWVHKCKVNISKNSLLTFLPSSLPHPVPSSTPTFGHAADSSRQCLTHIAQYAAEYRSTSPRPT